MKNVLFTLIALGLSCLILLGLLEIGVRALNRLALLPPTSVWEFRYRQPAPYADASYFSRAFIDEQKSQPGGWTTPEGTRLVLPNDFEGTWFNIRNHQRVTTDQPSAFKHTVHLFGGSTMYSAEVPDSETIASYLQRHVNERAPDTWRVENWGASTVTASQQVERLKTVAIKPGDIVIFYDGVNDALQGVFYNNPNGWIVQSNRDHLKNAGLWSYVIRAQIALRDRSALGALLMPYMDSEFPAHVKDPARMNMLVNETTIRFNEALVEAVRYTESKGARFIHVLQPHLFTQTEWSDYEHTIMANPLIIPAGIQESVTAAYPAFQTMLANMQADGSITTLDATDALDTLGDVNLDFCHVNHAANARIADILLPMVQ